MEQADVVVSMLMAVASVTVAWMVMETGGDDDDDFVNKGGGGAFDDMDGGGNGSRVWVTMVEVMVVELTVIFDDSSRDNRNGLGESGSDGKRHPRCSDGDDGVGGVR